MAEAAIHAGARGLWIEKAVACSLREARLMREMLLKSGVKAIVDHPRRADSAYRAVRRIINQRTLGDLLEVTCLMSGCLIHTGTHSWDMLDFWCGRMAGAAGWLERAPAQSGPIVDCGGNAHILFESGVHAFVAGNTREYYIFQFDLAFKKGRIQIGNDIRKVLLPGPSRLYSGFLELLEAEDYDLSDPYPYPMIYDLVHAIETGVEPLLSVENAITAFEMGLSIFQSHREGHRQVRPQDLDETLRIDSV
jgi:predicted dehydrogenase